jgi:hypothetical protein
MPYMSTVMCRSAFSFSFFRLPLGVLFIVLIGFFLLIFVSYMSTAICRSVFLYVLPLAIFFLVVIVYLVELIFYFVAVFLYLF